MIEHERDVLAHLASDWDAQAAQLEHGHTIAGMDWAKAKILRECAGQLRDRLLQLRAPVPGPEDPVAAEFLQDHPVPDPSAEYRASWGNRG